MLFYMASVRSRGWCFTLNNYTDAEINILKNINSVYIIFGKELAPTTGTPHLQGYVYLPNQRTKKSLIKEVPRASWQKAHGTGHANFEYCSKEDAEFYEHGVRPRQGERSDIAEIKNKLDDGHTLFDIILSNGLSGLHVAEALRKHSTEKRTWKPEVKWYWGESGSGKTRTAFEECPNAWVSGRNLKWWDGYEGHPDVIIDDFREDHCSYVELLRILDRYPFRVETKGSSQELLARKIIITSIFSPEKVFSSLREPVSQLLRRIDQVVEFGKSEIKNDSEVRGNTDTRTTLSDLDI